MPKPSERFERIPPEPKLVEDTASSKMREEAIGSTHAIRPSATSHAAELRDFAAGIVHGAAHSGIEFIDMGFATRCQISGVARQTLNTLRTATHFTERVLDNRMHDITADVCDAAQSAVNWLKDYGEKSAAERGGAVGGLALDMLVTGVGLGIARSLMRAAKPHAGLVELQSVNSRQQFDEYIKEFASIKGALPPELAYLRASAEFGATLDKLIADLPLSLQAFVARCDAKVGCAKGFDAQFHGQFSGAAGLFTVETHGKPFIWLAENHHLTKSTINARHVELTLRHELTHLVDCFGHESQWLSDLPAFKNILEEEFELLDKSSRKYLFRRLGRGSEQIMRKEIVAEIVSRHLVPSGGFFDKFFKTSFPRLRERLTAPDSPFMFD